MLIALSYQRILIVNWINSIRIGYWNRRLWFSAHNLAWNRPNQPNKRFSHKRKACYCPHTLSFHIHSVTGRSYKDMFLWNYSPFVLFPKRWESHQQKREKTHANQIFYYLNVDNKRLVLFGATKKRILFALSLNDIDIFILKASNLKSECLYYSGHTKEIEKKTRIYTKMWTMNENKWPKNSKYQIFIYLNGQFSAALTKYGPHKVTRR